MSAEWDAYEWAQRNREAADYGYGKTPRRWVIHLVGAAVVTACVVVVVVFIAGAVELATWIAEAL